MLPTSSHWERENAKSRWVGPAALPGSIFGLFGNPLFIPIPHIRLPRLPSHPLGGDESKSSDANSADPSNVL